MATISRARISIALSAACAIAGCGSSFETRPFDSLRSLRSAPQDDTVGAPQPFETRATRAPQGDTVGAPQPFETRPFDSLRSLRSAPQDDTTSSSVTLRSTRSVRLEGPRSPIKHVVFIVQENRSFNNLFMGYPGAKTQNYGYDERGRKVMLHAQGLSTTWDIHHVSTSFFDECDGTGTLPGTDCKMDGWNRARETNDPPDAPFAYVPRKEIAPYWTMARQYVLADRMFASNLDASFTAHQYVVAAYSSRAVDGPLSDWGCEGGKGDTIPTLTDERTYGPRIEVCFKNATLGVAADNAGLSWRFYAGALDSSGGTWSSYQADRSVYDGPDWNADVISPPSQFITDVGSGKLSAITWITPPTWQASDHPGLSGKQGPAWVASLVDAIGESKFWKSTAIFIMWDDWGGWFDPVKPVYEDYDGLGFRVPLIVVSPYAKQGSVTHVQYETSSVLRFIEDNFGLPQLAKSDRRANDPAADPAVFDYRQKPRAFEPIKGAHPAAYWRRAESSAPADQRAAANLQRDGDD